MPVSINLLNVSDITVTGGGRLSDYVGSPAKKNLKLNFHRCFLDNPRFQSVW